jgi:hypothetical protein
MVVILGQSLTGLLKPDAGFARAAPEETCASAPGATPSQQRASRSTGRAWTCLERALSKPAIAVAFRRK